MWKIQNRFDPPFPRSSRSTKLLERGFRSDNSPLSRLLCRIKVKRRPRLNVADRATRRDGLFLRRSLSAVLFLCLRTPRSAGKGHPDSRHSWLVDKMGQQEGSHQVAEQDAASFGGSSNQPLLPESSTNGVLHGGSGWWQGIADRAANTMGMRLDLHVPVSTKASLVVESQRASMSEIQEWGPFAAAAVLLLALAFVFDGSRNASKYMTIVLSMMWASQGLVILKEVVRRSGGEEQLWPVEGCLAFAVYFAQSVLTVVFGSAGFIMFNRPLARIKTSMSHQVGCLLLALSFAMPAANMASQGKYFKLPFAVDIFTLGLILSSVVDTGYSKQVCMRCEKNVFPSTIHVQPEE